MKTKSIEDLNSKNEGVNSDSPNPYIRKYGSFVKSHFSQSKCEIFNSSDEEDKVPNNVSMHFNNSQNEANLNSLDKINSQNNNFNFNSELAYKSSLQHLDNTKSPNIANKSLYCNKSEVLLKNSPSICNDKNSPELLCPNLQVLEEKNMHLENDADSLEADLQNEEENLNGSQLIITGSRRSSVGSFRSVDFDTNNLNEPGTDLQIGNSNKIEVEDEDENKNNSNSNRQIEQEEETFNSSNNNPSSIIKNGKSENTTANNSFCLQNDNKIEEEN